MQKNQLRFFVSVTTCWIRNRKLFVFRLFRQLQHDISSEENAEVIFFKSAILTNYLSLYNLDKRPYH